MKNLYVVVILALVIISCAPANKRLPEINYLGQAGPGMEAKLFAPGTISTKANEHSGLAFSPDGSVVLWAIMDRNFMGRLFEMKFENGAWSKPATPSFADTLADYYCPSFAPDGSKLYFSSRRKAPDGYPTGKGNRIWSVDRTNGLWGNPVPIDTVVSKAEEFSHSIARSGAIYFSSALKDSASLNIWMATMNKDGYTKPILLPIGINTAGYDDGPYISPDEAFLIFESTRPEGIGGSHDLYITFKNNEGGWGIPLNMGPKINSDQMERFPRLSPDGKYFFFGSNRDKSEGKVGFDIYWIDAKIIDELKAQQKK
jgi:Tol biopolymer transport system component